MTKDEIYKKAVEMIKKQPDKGRSYIRGCLTVKSDGELSNKLRDLLNVSIKKSKAEEKREEKSTGTKAKSRTRSNVGSAKKQNATKSSKSKNSNSPNKKGDAKRNSK